MGDPARQTDVLGRKASAARRAFEARAMSPAKALRRALSRSADVLWDLALVTHGVGQEIADQDQVVEMLPPRGLLLLLDGPGGALGLAMVDREILTGLTEVQTILQVTQMPVEDRALTPTDAAMVSPLLDGTLERFERYLDGHPLHAQLAGYRFGAMLEDPRAAGLLLDAASYRVFSVSVDLALGRRKGDMMIVLPERPEAEDPLATTEAGEGAEGPHEKTMTLLPVRMEAVLSRVTLPLSVAQRLRPGDLVPLPPDALDSVEFVSGSEVPIAGGRLGQMNGMRAVRLRWPEGAADRDRPEPGAMIEREATAAALSEAPQAPPHGGPSASPEPAPAASDLAEDLPDLPPMEFDTGDFGFGDMSPAATPEAEADQPGDLMGDFDFAAAPLDIGKS